MRLSCSKSVYQSSEHLRLLMMLLETILGMSLILSPAIQIRSLHRWRSRDFIAQLNGDCDGQGGKERVDLRC